MSIDVEIERLQKHHDRDQFDCGEPALNHYLQKIARQAAEKHISTTYVACPSDHPHQVIGYCTIANFSVQAAPQHPKYKNYHHPLPAVLLGRLGVTQDWKGKHIGEYLLIHAIGQTVVVAQTIGVIGLYVDPKYPGVIPFYEKYGFAKAVPDDPNNMQMWLHVDSCSQVVAALS